MSKGELRVSFPDKAPGKTSDLLFNFLFLAVTGQGGDLPWSDNATRSLELSELSLGLHGKKHTRASALLVIDAAIERALAAEGPSR